jgi:hypothetical protein
MVLAANQISRLAWMLIVAASIVTRLLLPPALARLCNAQRAPRQVAQAILSSPAYNLAAYLLKEMQADCISKSAAHRAARELGRTRMNFRNRGKAMTTVRFVSQAKRGPLAAIFAVAIMTTGCTTIKEGIGGTEHEDVAPFAQTTVEVLGIQNIQLRDNELVYLRFLVDEDFVALDKLQAALQRTDTFRDRVISYSIDLVRITEMYDEEEDKVTAFADGIDEQLGRQAIDVLQMSRQEWEAVIAEIRSQPDFLAALRAVQPVINRSGKFYEDLLTEIEVTVLVDVRAGFDDRIQAEFAKPLQFLDNHYNRRDEILTGLNLINAYRHGDDDAIEGLRNDDIVFDSSLLPRGKFTTKDVNAIDQVLRDELVQNSLLLDQLKADVADYKASVEELDRKEAEVIADLGLARLQFLTWSRSHQALANGVKEPGKWMELSSKAAKLVRGAL